MAKTPARGQSLPRGKTPDADGQVSHVRYSRDVAQEICERIAMGEPWVRICNTGRMPSYATLYGWRQKHAWFADQLAIAREMAAERAADRAVEVAEQTTPATVQADRLKVTTLLRRAAMQMGKNRELAARDAEARRLKLEAERLELERRPTRVIFSVRQFETYVGDDGRKYVREIREADDATGGAQ